MRWPALEHARIAIWGAGREGRAALAALRKEFPSKLLTVICREDEVAAIRDQAASDDPASTLTPTPSPSRGRGFTPFPLEGGRAGDGGDGATQYLTATPTVEALAQFDVIIKSPGISPYQSPAREAIDAGVRFTSGTRLWSQANPRARVIAVTGTKGKSTTSALIAHLLRAAGRTVALAGNIGMPLLELLDSGRAPDWFVFELSSFQTRELDTPPEIAVLLNLYPEHLDWHGSAQRYYADKCALLGAPGKRPRISVLPPQIELPLGARPETGVRLFDDSLGFHVREDAIWRGARRVLDLRELPLPGRHNAANLCAALTAVEAAGEDAIALAAAVSGFKPLPHRLQTLGIRNGVEYVNDSISTTPHATIAALEHLQGRTVTVLVGGYDRGLDWSAFADHVATHAPHAIIAMGQNGARIHDLLAPRLGTASTLEQADTLEAAMMRARALTPPGGVVLLSPGAPSFGAFRDYAERGRRFAELAGFDAARITGIEGMGL